MQKQNGGKLPLSYQSFVKLAGEPPSPLSTTYTSLPPVGHLGSCDISEVPTIKDLGYEDAKLVRILYFNIITLQEYLMREVNRLCVFKK
jgi:hypothetical protein